MSPAASTTVGRVDGPIAFRELFLRSNIRTYRSWMCMLMKSAMSRIAASASGISPA
jgi:hypothetical protein